MQSPLATTLKFLALLLLVHTFISLLSPGQQEQPRDLRRTKAAMSQISSGLSLFSSKALEETLSGSEKNIFLSPFSLSVALSMTALGARGQTQEEMLSSLGLPLKGEELGPNYGQFLQALGLEKNDQMKLSVANRLWIEKSVPLQSQFQEAAGSFFKATPEVCDFVHSSDKERVRINAWAEKETEGKIKDLLPSGSVDSSTALVISNAVYFKADWKKAFDAKITAQQSFHLLSKKDVKVPMMSQKDKFLFSQQADFKAIEKEYKSPEGKNYSMVFMLPEDEGMEGLKKTVQALAPERPGNPPFFLTQMFLTEVKFTVPKFKIEFEMEATSLMKKLGMKLAFSQADFSGISSHKLAISAIHHKAFVDVNEEGTEAAAATAVVMMRSAMPARVTEFYADRPFVFLIWERSTQTILFEGVLMNPLA